MDLLSNSNNLQKCFLWQFFLMKIRKTPTVFYVFIEEKMFIFKTVRSQEDQNKFFQEIVASDNAEKSADWYLNLILQHLNYCYNLNYY